MQIKSRNNGAMADNRSLNEPWTLGSLHMPNRVLLAPLAGIGNWFVRLQAKRYGAGMAVSEMVSSHAIHYRNERTCTEMLRIDPRERVGGPVSIQLFGEDPEIMRSAAAHLAAHTDADAIDINMGCPVPKVRRTGAGAGMLANPDLAVAITRAAREGAVQGGRELPVTVKLRSGLAVGEESGYELAHRLVAEGGAAAIGFHPRCAAVHHKGTPDYELAARLVQTLDAPVILTGGLHDVSSTLAAYEQTGAAAVMLARGALGNPWLFEQLLGTRDPDEQPARAEVLDELDWTIDRAIEHLGEDRATRYLRKFYPWYVARLSVNSAVAKRLNEALLRVDALAEARQLLGGVALPERALLGARDPRYTGALAASIQPAVPA
jgi:tRNA-dihydrouridine synthase B